jgi:hypothetical protein
MLLPVLALNVSLAVRVSINVQLHRVAAHGAAFDGVLVRAERDVHGHQVFLATEDAGVGRFLVG